MNEIHPISGLGLVHGKKGASINQMIILKKALFDYKTSSPKTEDIKAKNVRNR